jgi:hypothetical protein
MTADAGHLATLWHRTASGHMTDLDPGEGGARTMVDVTEDPVAPVVDRRRDFRLLRTQRVLQIVLGLFWLLDAGLQFQPYMFGSGFTTTYLLNNAHNQPDVVRWIITNVGNFVGPHVAVWNTFFALIQVAIGLGLLFRPTVRPALAVSFFWAFGVWFFGEGLGQIFTGSASALTGAPGSVFLYGLIGLMAWPRTAPTAEDREAEPIVGIASSAAAQGIGGAATPLLVWCGYWSLAAILFLLPDNRTPTSVSSAITGMSAGEPSTYAHFLNNFGGHFGSGGLWTTWLLAIGSLIVGFGPLLSRRATPFLAAGGVLATFFWISGQGLGGIFTGSGTDPNSGPLIVLLALAMAPAVLPDPATWLSPFSTALFRYPVLVLGGVVALVAGLFLSAIYPVAAQESTGTAMAGMTGMSGSATSGSSGQTASTATCTRGNNGSARSGLDVTNTPNMSMGGPGAIMNMNGADASAAAGLNTTKSNWHYTGPALPTAFAQELLAQGANGPTDVHMAATGCASEPTFSQQINATQYVQLTSRAVAGYATPSQAVAAGYVPVSPTNYPVVYYVNPTIVAANAAAKRTLDPTSIDGLVYAQTPTGTQELAAAMYVLPTTLTTPPMPYGPLVQWHQRTAVCGPSSATGATAFQITGTVPCAPGTVQHPTPYVTMVWQVPVAGGPLAIQPPDIQTVEASVMASSGS